MRKYDVTIREILERKLEIEAESREQAEQIACSKWMRGEPVLDAGDFKSVEYHAEEKVRKVERER